MDEDLLDKYFSGRCTPEEINKVKHFLEQPLVNENRILGLSWDNIQRHTRRARSLRMASRGWMYYSVAASVVLLISCTIIWKIIPGNWEIRNDTQHYEAFDAKGLQFRLPPEAAARINIGIGSYKADLRFCGGVRIHNTSERDVDMKLNMECASTQHTSLLKVLKDKRYLAFPYEFKSGELVIVEEDRIFDLPLPLQQKALEALEI